MAAWSFLAEHRHEAGYNANKSKEDMKTDDCEKHRDVDGISIPATIVVSCTVMVHHVRWNRADLSSKPARDFARDSYHTGNDGPDQCAWGEAKFVRAYPDRVGARPNIDPEHNRIEDAGGNARRRGGDCGNLQ